LKLVADESVDLPIVERLRADAHHVLYITDQYAGIDDDAVLGLANSSQSLLITQDKDFGELVFRRQLAHHGVILVRLLGLNPQLKADRVSEVLQEDAEAFEGAFTVISPGLLRVRRP
jgi:predicted nuclease of predicted toxin-antitoxin system